jgi:hypothetical protein
MSQVICGGLDKIKALNLFSRQLRVTWPNHLSILNILVPVMNSYLTPVYKHEMSTKISASSKQHQH